MKKRVFVESLNNLKGLAIVGQFIDETGAWVRLSDGMLLQIHDSEIEEVDDITEAETQQLLQEKEK